ncbi:sensor histidine kinase [Paenibacillus sp. P25]|nr:sensor histidine kinase [Paenibacillus sp. P25]
MVNVFPDYFGKSYESLGKRPDRTFYITDEKNRVIMNSSTAAQEAPLPSAQWPAGYDVFQFDEGIYHVTAKKTPRLNWNLISVVPKASLYQLPLTLIVTACILSALCLIICVAVALWLTRNNYRQVSGIIRILESADEPDSASRSPGPVRDIYEFIILNIVESFVQNNYLKVQLSERLYKMQALEFKALQSQINPHFLYNTLNSIYWKTFQLTRGPNEACQMLEQLSQILRYALDSSAKTVTLQEELAHIKSYVEIQQLRYNHHFSVTWEVPDSCLGCDVLKLSIQPLIENSIQYGIEARPHLHIKLKTRLEHGTLKVTVIDNGPGMGKDRLRELRASLHSDAEPAAGHVGIGNTNKRSLLQFGPDSRIRIVSRPGWGAPLLCFLRSLPRGIRPQQPGRWRVLALFKPFRRFLRESGT